MPQSSDLDLATIVSATSVWGGAPHLKAVKCPCCGGTNNHVEPPYLVTGDDYKCGWDGRGERIVVPFWGECSSKWQINVGFHKGESFIFVRIIEDCTRTQ